MPFQLGINQSEHREPRRLFVPLARIPLKHKPGAQSGISRLNNVTVCHLYFIYTANVKAVNIHPKQMALSN